MISLQEPYLLGIELHRVISNHKLFCQCKYQSKKSQDLQYSVRNQNIINHYLGTFGQTCEYEQDEIPPIIDKKILKKAVKILSRVHNIRILDNILFCRKEILDGSLVPGYQISAQIATGGQIVLDSGKIVSIDKVFLETDSATPVKDRPGVFRTDRQGLPLLQVSTKPIYLTGLETIQLLKKIQITLNPYELLPRSRQAIRQDINISTSQHPRVQIKGVDSLSAIPLIIEKELARMNESDESKVSTRKWTGLQTVFMRYPTGKKRLKRETDLPFYPIPAVWKKIKQKQSLDHNLKEIIKKICTRPRDWRVIRRFIANKGYESFDLPILEKCGSSSNWGQYQKYLNGSKTAEEILKGTSALKKTIAESEMVDFFEKNGIKELYRHYRNQITRNVKIMIKKREINRGNLVN